MRRTTRITKVPSNFASPQPYSRYTRFLSQFDKRGDCLSIEYGKSWWLHGDYEDLNDAMIEKAARYIPALLEQASVKAKAADLAEARRLVSKHGFKIQQG